MKYAENGTWRCDELVEDRRGLVHPGDQRDGVFPFAVGLRGVRVLAVRERACEQRRVRPVEHGEAPRQRASAPAGPRRGSSRSRTGRCRCRRRGTRRRARRARRTSRARGSDVRSRGTDAARRRCGRGGASCGACRRRRGRSCRSCRRRVNLLPHRDLPGLEVLLVAPQPAEVVVERAVLHHQHDDGVDRAVGRLRVEQATLRSLRRLAGPPGGERTERTAARRWRRRPPSRRRPAGSRAAARPRCESVAALRRSMIRTRIARGRGADESTCRVAVDVLRDLRDQGVDRIELLLAAQVLRRTAP